MTYPCCPVDEYGCRQYYLRTIAQVATRIINVDKQLAAAELARRPALAKNPAWRATRQTKPSTILDLLGKECFWIPPHRLHRNDQNTRDRWVATILHQPGWTGDWWRN